MLNPFRWLVIFVSEFFRNTAELIRFFVRRKINPSPTERKSIAYRIRTSISEFVRIVLIPIRLLFMLVVELFRNIFELLRFLSPLKKVTPGRVPLAGPEQKRTWAGFVVALPRILFDDTIGLLILWSQTKEPNPKASRLRLRRLIILSFVLALISGGVYLVFTSRISLSKEQIVQFRELVNRGEFIDAAKLAEPLLDQRCDAEPDLRFEFAKVLERLDRREDADLIYRMIAPLNEKGYPPANFVQALSKLKNLEKESNANLASEVAWHLKQSGDDYAAQLQLPWFRYYQCLGENARSIPYLRRASERNRGLLLVLADVYRRSGNLVLRQTTLEDALKHFDALIAVENPKTTDVIKYAETAMSLGRFHLAERVLLKQLASATANDEPQLRTQLANVCTLRFDEESARNPEQLPLERLTQALNWEPTNAPALDRLTQIQVSIRTPREKAEAAKILEDLLARGESVSLVHFVLGTNALARNDLVRAKEHLELSLKNANPPSAAYNNLAWVVLQGPSPDIERSSSLVETALQMEPNNPEFHDTRANIWFTQGKYEIALTEFEQILDHVGNNRDVHEKMAMIYDRLGDKRFADLHRVRAAALPILVLPDDLAPTN